MPRQRQSRKLYSACRTTAVMLAAGIESKEKAAQVICFTTLLWGPSTKLSHACGLGQCVCDTTATIIVWSQRSPPETCAANSCTLSCEPYPPTSA